jgi:hypothetical protein
MLHEDGSRRGVMSRLEVFVGKIDFAVISAVVQSGRFVSGNRFGDAFWRPESQPVRIISTWKVGRNICTSRKVLQKSGTRRSG